MLHFKIICFPFPLDTCRHLVCVRFSCTLFCGFVCLGLEARERAAEERAKMVAHKQQARTVSTLRADNIVLVERMNEELAAKRRASGMLVYVSFIYACGCYCERVGVLLGMSML